jgi:hypothetical protein
MLTRYNFEGLKEKALNGGQKEVNALGKWFELYGSQFFNGEYYEIDNQHKLFPVCETDLDEYGELIIGNIVDYILK